MLYDQRPWLASYDPGVPKDIEILEKSLPDRFDKIRKEFGKRTALHFLDISLTFEQIFEKSDLFAHFLSINGVKKGDVVAIHLPNTPQYIIALAGALKAGCIVSGLSPLLTPPEIVYQLNNSKAKVLVTLDALFEKRIVGIAPKIDSLKLVVHTGLIDFLPWYKRLLGKLLKKVPTGKISNIPDKTVTSFNDILKSSNGMPYPMDIDQNSPCFLQYTGGTTGVPKGALISNKNALCSQNQFYTWVKMQLGQDVILSGYPMFHTAGLCIAVASLSFGATQVLIPDPRNTGHIIKEINAYKPTIMANVPTLYLMLLKETKFSEIDFSGLKGAVSAAAPFPYERIDELEKAIGKNKLVELYGMTECSPLISCNPYEGKKKKGSVGLPLPSTVVRIMDLSSDDKEVEIGEEGELIVNGPQVMIEYYNNPTETKKSLREHDGKIWMHTGDVARMDNEGYLFLVDRTKDMINVGGYKVFSREVEEILYRHPSVDFCAVVSATNPERPETEIVKLVVQKKEAWADKSDDIIKQELIELAKKYLSPYKIPKIIEFMDKIPLTPIGKVDKKAIRKKTT